MGTESVVFIPPACICEKILEGVIQEEMVRARQQRPPSPMRHCDYGRWTFILYTEYTFFGSYACRILNLHSSTFRGSLGGHGNHRDGGLRDAAYVVRCDEYFAYSPWISSGVAVGTNARAVAEPNITTGRRSDRWKLDKPRYLTNDRLVSWVCQSQIQIQILPTVVQTDLATT